MTNGRSLSSLIAAQLIVTLALLAFAAFVGGLDTTTRSFIVGAVVGHWLTESPRLGKQVAEALAEPKVGA